MGSRNPPQTRVDLSIDARLMERVKRYARERGISPEALMVESVVAFMDCHSIADADLKGDDHARHLPDAGV